MTFKKEKVLRIWETESGTCYQFSPGSTEGYLQMAILNGAEEPQDVFQFPALDIKSFMEGLSFLENEYCK